MSYLFVIAFVAGAFSVLTPCILPVLPALVVVSDGQGRARVAGIVSGIVLSFCAVILLLTALVDALGISADALRYVSAALLLIFGLVLVVPALEARFQQAAQVIVRRSPTQARGNGFLPGSSPAPRWGSCGRRAPARSSAASRRPSPARGSAPTP